MATLTCEPTTPETGAFEPLIRLRDLERLLGVTSRTLNLWRAQGRIPKPDFAVGHPRWRSSTIRSWLESGKAGEVIE